MWYATAARNVVVRKPVQRLQPEVLPSPRTRALPVCRMPFTHGRSGASHTIVAGHLDRVLVGATGKATRSGRTAGPDEVAVGRYAICRSRAGRGADSGHPPRLRYWAEVPRAARRGGGGSVDSETEAHFDELGSRCVGSRMWEGLLPKQVDAMGIGTG